MALSRSIPTSMNPATVAAIDGRLAAIRDTHRVAIPLAIESGSRAWGFPSPDSDYDCRFVFVRALDDYLTPWRRRDVIETPLDGELDVNGWDVGKALHLLLKGNAVIIEWLTSPIAYGVDEAFRSEFLGLAGELADRRMVGRHYYYLGTLQKQKHLGAARDIALKKLFYVVRPVAALRWLRLRPEAVFAPMHFPTLMLECDPPASVTSIVKDLLARKSVTRELGSAPLPPEIAAFIEEELALGEIEFAVRKRVVPEGWKKAKAEDFFRHALRSWGAPALSG